MKLTVKTTSIEEYIKLLVKNPRRQLEGEEYDRVYTMLKLMEPHTSYNNQRTFTDVYKIGDRTYYVSYVADDGVHIMEEIIKE